LKQIDVGQEIPSPEYLEAYPNLKLARMLGHKKLIGSQWKRYPYKGSYYFNIKLSLNTPEFEGIPIEGELRISDHKANPYTFSRECPPTKIGDKKYAFGISIVFPRLRANLGSNKGGVGEAHVFEYISTDMSDVAVNKLKKFLSQYVKSLAVAEIGFGDAFSPNKYKEVTIGKPIFDTSSEAAEHERLNKNRTFGAAALNPRNVVSNQPVQKKAKPVNKDLEYYMRKLGVQPKLIMVNTKEGRRHQTITYDGRNFHAKQLNGLWRPYNQKTHKFLGFNDGLYAWVTPDGRYIGAAIVKDRKLEPIGV
jgi:hypothetical protein